MTADPKSIDLSEFMAEHLERAQPDLLRSLLKTFVEALMGAEADAICGAPYGTRSPERVTSRKRLPGTGVGHPGGHDGGRDPESCGKGRTSPIGCCGGDAEPSGR